jgi:hypothetical protein
VDGDSHGIARLDGGEVCSSIARGDREGRSVDKQTGVKMLPCPFCGAVPDSDNNGTFDTICAGKWGFVVCCCQGPEVRTNYHELEHWKQDAIDAWNERA